MFVRVTDKEISDFNKNTVPKAEKNWPKIISR